MDQYEQEEMQRRLDRIKAQLEQCREVLRDLGLKMLPKCEDLTDEQKDAIAEMLTFAIDDKPSFFKLTTEDAEDSPK